LIARSGWHPKKAYQQSAMIKVIRILELASIGEAECCSMGAFMVSRIPRSYDGITNSPSVLGYLVLLTNALRALFPDFDEEMVKRNVTCVLSCPL
jgi:hypothetical protein